MPTTPEFPEKIVIECSSTDAEQLFEEFQRSAQNTPVSLILSQAIANQATSRGSDASSLIQVALNIDVQLSIDLARVIWASAAVILLVRPRVRTKGYDRSLRSMKDLRDLYRLMTGGEPPDSGG